MEETTDENSRGFLPALRGSVGMINEKTREACDAPDCPDIQVKSKSSQRILLGVKAVVRIGSGAASAQDTPIAETPSRKQRKKKSYTDVKKKVDEDINRKKLAAQKEADLNTRLREDLVKRGITSHPLLKLADEKAQGSQDDASSITKGRQERAVSFVGGALGVLKPTEDIKIPVGPSEEARAVSVRSVRTTASAQAHLDYAGRPRGLQAYDLALNPVIEQRMRMKRYGYGYKPKAPLGDYIPKEDDYRDGSMSSESSRLSAEGMATTLKLRTGATTPRVSKMFPFGRPLMHSEAHQTAPWLTARLKHSCRAVRFSLPIDLEQLKDMKPMDYLLKYCHINQCRKNVYKQAFEKKLKKGTKVMNFQQAAEAMKRVTAGQVLEGDIKALFRLLRLNFMMITLEDFNMLCAVGERLLYATLAGRQGEAGVCRSYLESADFCYVEWRLREMTLKDQHTRRLLLSLGGL